MTDPMKSSAMALLAFCAIIAGCKRAASDIRLRIADELSGLSVVSEAETTAARERCRAASGLMMLLDAKECEDALSTWSDRLRNVRFGDGSYGKRSASLERYIALADDAFAMLEPTISDRNVLWTFRLDNLRRINDELQWTASESMGTADGYGDTGDLTTKRGYREILRSARFRLIQSLFETGPFSTYYNGLSDNAKSNWIARIEAVAERKVVIYDPQDPFRLLPRYVPVDEREWLPSSAPEKPREYIEHLGGGKKMKMREVR